MEEKIRQIISQFIKVPAEQISSLTVIDRSAVASSIMVHRMYGKLANEGVVIENYWDIRTFGELMQKTQTEKGQTSSSFILPAANETPTDINQSGIGIDIEMISNMPVVNDYREDSFYTLNFAPQEIAYCILQTSPLHSFAGLFAAKEAICKCNNQYSHTPFHQILISHLPGGMPVHTNFHLSITHAEDIAVAIAIPRETLQSGGNTSIAVPVQQAPSKIPLLLSVLALLISCIAVFVLLLHH